MAVINRAVYKIEGVFAGGQFHRSLDLIRAWGPTRDEAWREAIGQARAAGMLGAPAW